MARSKTTQEIEGKLIAVEGLDGLGAGASIRTEPSFAVVVKRIERRQRNHSTACPAVANHVRSRSASRRNNS